MAAKYIFVIRGSLIIYPSRFLVLVATPRFLGSRNTLSPLGISFLFGGGSNGFDDISSI